MTTTFGSPGFGSLALLFSLVLIGCVARPSVRVGQPYTAIVGPVIIAHRGGSLEAPENTLEALRHGVEVGADWVEYDVRLTEDDEVVVFHDETLGRTTDGRGLLAETTLAELQRLHAGRPTPSEWAKERMAEVGVSPTDFGDRFATARVPTLTNALAVQGARFMIELKKCERGPKLVEKTIETIYAANAADRVAFGSFDPELLWLAYNRDPSFPLIGILYEPEMIDVMLQLPVTVLAVRYDLAQQTLDVVPPGVAVWVWTVYSVETAENLTMLGVHGLITDVPGAVVTALRTPPDLILEPSKM